MSSPLLIALVIAILVSALSNRGVPDAEPREIVVVLPQEEQRRGGCLPAVLILISAFLLVALLAR